MNKLAKLLGLPENVNITFNPNDITLLSSLLSDGNGNYNSLRFVMDKNAPTIKQRIYK